MDAIPHKALDQHLVVLGKTGSGKSSALRYIVEHYLLSKDKRVCIVDPKGDWWGVKVAADGKSPGLPVILFGDFKNPDARDVPINDRSGKHIAELVSEGNRPCVIGLRGWTQGAMTRFWIDFASTLFGKNAGELYLIADEFHNFAPKGKILSPEAGQSLHWSNRLLSEGRGLGIVCLTASQRPQKVHNDSLTSHETLVAMRVIHKADRDAIKDWIDGNGDPTLGKEVLTTLAGLPRGEAWVWSPEIGFGPKRVKFPMFQTFDSFAPPQLQKRVSDKGWASVDLSEVKNALAEAVKEAEANDPKLLRAEDCKAEKAA
jgi:DNA helicase HerA-like ATPase